MGSLHLTAQHLPPVAETHIAQVIVHCNINIAPRQFFTKGSNKRLRQPERTGIRLFFG
jgi:hypothetical protein